MASVRFYIDRKYPAFCTYDQELMNEKKHLLFPSTGQTVNRIEWQNMHRFIIENMPQSIRDTLRTNFYKVKELEDGFL